MGFLEPTPIQVKAVPLGLEGKDILATAQTGTGKTAAFCLPIAVKLLENPAATALVLAPTRELALQIDEFWRKLTQHAHDLRSAVIIGGASFFNQNKAIARRPRMIIATPGRLLDHLGRGNISLSNVAAFTLDEADRMLDMGFAPQLNEIVSLLPRQRQNFLFSATWDKTLDDLCKKVLFSPVRIAVGTTSQAAGTISQSIVPTTVKDKNEALLNELNDRKGLILIFARTQVRTDRVSKFLTSYGIDVGRIHGGRTQSQRNLALKGFKAGKPQIMVATDIASRGIDVVDIAHVINYDLPQLPEDYIHRIGRTGRNGAVGEAISFVLPEDREQWREILRLLKKTGSAEPKVRSQEGMAAKRPANQQPSQPSVIQTGSRPVISQVKSPVLVAAPSPVRAAIEPAHPRSRPKPQSEGRGGPRPEVKRQHRPGPVQAKVRPAFAERSLDRDDAIDSAQF